LQIREPEIPGRNAPTGARRLIAWIHGHPLAVLLTAIGVIFAFALFNHAPVPSMEPRFAEVVREMAARGQFLIPIKNGVPYIEYPPLYFWLGVAGHLAGLSIPAAIRLPGYLALLLWVFWLARLQQRLFPAWPRILLPLTAAALPGILYNFFTAQSDSILILGTLIAFTGYVGHRRGFNWELWCGLALATLAKGPVALAITLPVFGMDMLIDRGLARDGIAGLWRRIMEIKPFRGLGLVLLLNAPWYVAGGFVVGWDFVRAVVVYQNFTRFLVGFDHLRPWWYYGRTIFYDLFPLAFLFPIGVACGATRLRKKEWRVPLVWALWTLLFFSLSQSKQGKYILPAAPAIAVLALAVPGYFSGIARPERVHAWLRRWAAFLLAVFAGLVIVAVPILGPRLLDTPAYAGIGETIDARPGKLVTYLWPRSMELYELGAPLPYVQSARALYRDVHDNQLKAGDYVLANRKYLPGGHRDSGEQRLSPAPAPPYFKEVATFKAEGKLTLYRVLPGADKLPVPPTPKPPPRHWWDQFDTD
jgi:4-amino-4-deoxy-L-arabinose transferase-like glycosyltransferase